VVLANVVCNVAGDVVVLARVVYTFAGVVCSVAGDVCAINEPLGKQSATFVIDAAFWHSLPLG
jgi:hypothetical protein